ncbi:kinase-like domain-containing protein [Syncephalis fuscata]|nr:kinase-like domain-containing protein [Syncephalis fuscata]
MAKKLLSRSKSSSASSSSSSSSSSARSTYESNYADKPQLADYITSHSNSDVRDMLELIREDSETLAEFRCALVKQGRRLTHRYLILNSVLGSGRNGGVRLGYDLQQDVFIALKRYRKAFSVIGGCLQYTPQQQIYNRALRHEMWMDRKLSHLEGFLHMREVFETPRSIYYIMDVADGSLYDHIAADNHKPICEKQLKRMLRPVAKGLAHTHRLGYAHRDIKLDNVLVLRRDDGQIELRLTDLEFTAFCNHETGHDIMGTPGYMAPEVEAFVTSRLIDYRKADAWSFGVMIYACLTGHFPFNPDYPVHRQRLVFPKHLNISCEAKDLLCQLLDKDDSTRMTIVKALRHPFFKRF